MGVNVILSGVAREALCILINYKCWGGNSRSTYTKKPLIGTSTYVPIHGDGKGAMVVYLGSMQSVSLEIL